MLWKRLATVQTGVSYPEEKHVIYFIVVLMHQDCFNQTMPDKYRLIRYGTEK